MPQPPSYSQSLGVLNNTSDVVNQPQFRMQGKTVLAKPESEIKAIEQANRELFQDKVTLPTSTINTSAAATAAATAATASASIKQVKKPTRPRPGNDVQQSPLTKPAIIGVAGTLAPVKFSQRAKPPARPSSEASMGSPLKKRTRKSRQGLKTNSIKQAHSQANQPWERSARSSDNSDSYMSDESEDLTRTTSDSIITSRKNKAKASRLDSAGSTGSRKSAGELLAEAQDIAASSSLPIYRQKYQQAKQDGHTLDRRGSKVKLLEAEKQGLPKERSVDDIISSLKAAREMGGVKSQADIKIQQIMQRVISRTAAVLEIEQPETTDNGMDYQEVSDYQGVDEADKLDGEERGSGELMEQYDSKDGIPVITVVEGATSQASIGDLDGPRLTEEKAIKTQSLLADKEDGLSATKDTSKDELAMSVISQETRQPVHGKSSVEFVEEASRINWDEEEMELQQAWMDLKAPLHVTYEEILKIEGESQTRVPRITVRGTNLTDTPIQEKPQIGERMPALKPAGYRTSIHHFCTVPTHPLVSGGLQLATRMHHTPSKYSGVRELLQQSDKEPGISDILHTVSKTASATTSQLSRTASARTAAAAGQYTADQQQRLMSAAAQRILQEAQAMVEGSDSHTLETWERRAQEVFDDEELEISGHRLPIKQDQSRLYWTPAPPKMNLPSSYIRSTLYPEFQGASLDGDNDQIMPVDNGTDEIGEEEVGVTWDEALEDDKGDTKRSLYPLHRSCEDLTKLGWNRRETGSGLTASPYPSLEGVRDEKPSRTGSVQATTPTGRSSSVNSSIHEIKHRFSQIAVTTTLEDQDMVETERYVTRGSRLHDVIDTYWPVRRIQSAPSITEDNDIITLHNDFDADMDEVARQQEQISAKATILQNSPEELESVDLSKDVTLILTGTTPQSNSSNVVSKKPSPPTLAEKARQAGMKYVMYPKQKRRKKKKPLDPHRLMELESFLNMPPRKLSRSESLPQIKMVVPWALRVPLSVRLTQRSSLPDVLDFEEYCRKNQTETDPVSVREWVRGIWDGWFDEVYPATEVDSESDFEEEMSPTASPTKRHSSAISSVASVEIDSIEPIMETDTDQDIVEWLHEEVLTLSEVLQNAAKPSAFDLCRRGAMYRKLGKLKLAWDDLNSAIALEPQLLDAYWHRHLLFLIRKKSTKALEDLNTILKINREHVGAYKSRAEIFSQKGDLTMAIMNYSQTLKLDPDDHEAYYKRAEMYERRGEMLLALEDYRHVTRLMPSKTEAIYKRGIYQFNHNKNWMAAIKDFTELLVQEPANALARTYRGRALAKHGRYVHAVEDLSSAIHLDPLSSVAFYHRGCLLRWANPKQALQDLSVSILIDDTEDNVLAFFHRAILYMDDGRYEDAIADFEKVLKLDKTIAAAHVNLGLIYMTKLENYHKAIQKFSSAVKVDPVYVRALVCRGEAYHKIHDLKNALLDFTRAIHLRPDKQQYYMYRGEMLLKMKNLELASFCVRHAAELSHGLGSSATQQAAVQSFLHNYTKAIDILSTTSRSQPSAPLFILLGKTQIKAKKYRDAVNSLEKALNFMKPWQERHSWPQEAAEVNYLIGMCHTEIPNYLKAFEAFNNAIKINADYPEAYYQRGLTRMKLHQSKGILDFNRALALNPKLFQAYLSRAAYYGMKGRYSKGIVNCNEAVKLQPKSVRAYLYRGALKYYIHAYQLAIKDLCKALQIDNTCSLAYFNRAVCYHTTKDYSKALRDYGIVLMLGEANAHKVLINRGLMYFAKQDYKNAREDFAQAVRMNPHDPKIRHTLGLCCHKLNRLEDAVTVFTSALEVDVFFLDAYIGRGNTFMDYGHEITSRMARRDYERAVHLNPHCLPARVNLAYNLQVCGFFQQAWYQLTACLQINPNYQAALEGRAVVCLQMNDAFAAFLDLNAAIKLRSSAELFTNRGVVNQFMRDHHNAMRDYQSAIRMDAGYALAYFNAANLYFHNRQFTQAIDYYNRALLYNPDDESAVLNRGITKVLMRDARGALEDFQLAVKMSPLSGHVYFNRGNLYSSLRRYELAEGDYTQALELQPDDPLVYKRRAEVRGKLGMRADAITDYKRAIELQSQRHPARN